MDAFTFIEPSAGKESAVLSAPRFPALEVEAKLFRGQKKEESMSKHTQALPFQAGAVFSLTAQGVLVSTFTILALRAAMLSVHPGAVTVAAVSPPGSSVSASGFTRQVSITPAVELVTRVPGRALTIEEKTPAAEPIRLSQEARLDISPPLPMETTLTGEAVSQSAASPAASMEGRGKGPSLQEFLRVVRSRLDAAKQYPLLARRLGQEGTAQLQFTITLAGETSNIHLAETSGWKALDQETVELVKRVGQFPAPPMMWKEGVTIQVPVVFELARR